jgi:glucuronokinase
MALIRAHAHPRIGVLGNPSDGYGGRVLSLSFTDFEASVELGEEGPTAAELFDRLERGVAVGLERLTSAATRRFARSHPLPESTRLEFTTATNIPRQVGLSGSSAVMLAALRALARRTELVLSPPELALLAWEAETVELGIAAGPQDRVAQAHGGLLEMDFSMPWGPDSFRHHDPALLPPFFIAWDPRPGTPSGEVHDTVRERYDSGEALVRETMSEFPRFTTEGISALERGDLASFLGCMNANFDARAKIWDLSERDLELISIGREAGCATKFTGSGGAVICAATDLPNLERAEAAYSARAFPTLRPTTAPSVTEIKT